MNYYIQGDAANADKIKAAFEKEGYDVTGFNMCNDNILFFTYEYEGGGKVISTTNAKLYTANIIKTHPDYKELELPVEPKFKIGDWIVRSNGSSDIPIQVYGIKNDRYLVTNMLGSKGKVILECQDKWRPWLISDAKDGDVLVYPNEIYQDEIFLFNLVDNNSVLYHCCFDGNLVEHSFYGFSNEELLHVHLATKEQRELLFQKIKESGYEWDADKKKLLNAVSKFKVGDWIVQNDNGIVSQITKTINGKDEYGEYRAYEHTNGYFAACFENEYHIWTVQDAKPGDVLMCESGWTCIFKDLDLFNEMFSSYCFMATCLDFMPYSGQCHTLDSRINGEITPATEQQRNLFFKKMKEAGYQWNVDKKELRKIQPHYDIANFQPFDKVLVRDGDMEYWNTDLFSSYHDEFHCFRGSWEQCIPFDGNKHLLGTTDMPSEEYINW